MEKMVILCVDDERSILDGLHAQLLRAFGEKYIIELVQSGEEALEVIQEIIEENLGLPIIISDQLMPGIKGDELLIKAHEILPNTLKILLTGQADLKAISNAVNHANLYRYIEKPWEGQDMMLTVKEAIRVFQMDRELEAKNRLLEKHNLALEELVQQRTDELIREKQKSDELLLNILPKEVAEELKNTGSCTAKSYERATVLFTDFKDFTNLVASIPSKILVSELNEIFSKFDDIMEAHQVTKIETIGDAYLAVSGLPNENEEYASQCIHAAEQIIRFLEKRNQESDIQWNIRIGIHSGPLVAGVVGKTRFSYDIFGDTVNTASRIESNGEVGKINISNSTYQILKDNPNFIFTSRGAVFAKGKGEMDMYFVEIAQS